MLESMIGQVASVNTSPTLSAKLVNVGFYVCKWEVTPNHYSDKGNDYVGETFYQPLSISGNCFWGV